MQLTKNQTIIAGAAGILIVGFILVLLGILPGLKSSNPDPRLRTATLTMWTVGDSARAYEAAIADFKSDYPNTKIEIRTFSDHAGYEKTLLNALAAGQGPDIFVAPNSALNRDLPKLTPLPTDLLPISQLNRLFPQIVSRDFVQQNQIYALPLAIDTLAMYYNRDLLNAAGIALPPATWEELQTIVPQLTKFDTNRNIAQSGAAIGGSGQTDLLLAMMLQKDAPFSGGGLAALNFYLGFANARNPQYSWNDSLGNNQTAFVNEKSAIIFDYAKIRPLIAAANPNLNFAVAAIPQFTGQAKPAAYAEYWGYGVSKQSRESRLAWEFILNLTAKDENANAYLVSVQKPPALNSLISKLSNDPDWEIFAKQALIAKPWPQPEPLTVSQIFSRAIANVLNGRANANQALQQAEKEYNALTSN